MYTIKTFRNLLYEYELVFPWENPSSGKKMKFFDFSTTRQLLTQVSSDSSAVLIFRSVLADISEVGPLQVSKFNDHQVIDKLSQMLVLGRVKLYRRELKLPSFQERKTIAVTKTQVSTPSALSWVEVVVVWDDTGNPVSNLQLTIETPDGQSNTKQTDSDGKVRLDQITDGMCEVRCGTAGATLDECLNFIGEGENQAAQSSGSSSQNSTTTKSGNPLTIANVEAHKVKTGETPASLAGKAGMPWKDLAKFNWGTDDPDEINQHLAQDVGCTKKAEDGKYMLDDGDTPGIIYVPKQWKYSAGTGIKHTIRVSWAEKQVVSMRWFRIKLVQKDKDTYKVLDNKGFEFKPDDERYGCSAVTNGQGVFEIKIPDTIQTATLNFDDLSIDVILEKDFPAAKTVKGAQARLNNLGYEPGPVDGSAGKRTKEAIKKFQRKHSEQDQSVPPSGELDQKTQDDLKSDYGC